MRPSRRYRIFIHVAAIFVSLVFLAPFAWMLDRQHLLAEGAARACPLDWIPNHISFERYHEIFTAHGDNPFANFRSALLNSIDRRQRAAWRSRSRSGSSAPTRSPGCASAAQRPLLLVFLSTYMVPPIALVIPLYLIMVNLQSPRHAARD